MTIDMYMHRLRTRLTRFGPYAQRSLAEIRDHLLDSMQSIAEGGTPLDEAEHEAVRRFGDARSIAEQLAIELKKDRDPMERILKILSIMNMFTAVWGLAACALLNPKVELLAATGLVSIVTVAVAVACMRRDIEPGVLIVSGVALAAVGAAGVLWALLGTRPGFVSHIGLALLMSAYFAQGVVAMWAGSRRHKLAHDEPVAA